MKICITSEGKTLDANVDPRFGRCQYFIFFDTETKKYQAQENPNVQFQGGAGIQSAQLMASKGVKAVLTGNIGPNAFQTLNAGAIDVYTGASGSVKEVIEAYESGKLKKTHSPGVGLKFGMGRGRMGRGNQ